MLICHNCGTIIENKAKQCHHCHNLLTPQSAIALAEPVIENALKIQLEPQPAVINRFVTANLIEQTANANSSNGHADNDHADNGHADNGHSESEAPGDKFFLSLPESIKPIEQTVSNTTPHTEPDFFAQLPNIFTQNEAIDETIQTRPDTKDNLGIQDKEIKSPLSEAISHNNGDSNSKKTSNPSDWLLQVAKEEEAAINPVQEATFTKVAPLQGTKSETAAPNVHKRSFVDQKDKGQNKKKSTKNYLPTNFTFKSSWQSYLFIALIVVLLLWKGFEAFCAVGGNLFSSFSNISLIGGQGNPISGRWQFAAKWNNTGCRGEIILHQRGNQIFGQGMDSQFGQYKFNGTRNGNHIDFLKQYFVGNTFVGHPIELHGDIDPASKPLFINGNFSLEYMQGGKWRGKPVIVSGIWEAEMVQPLIEENNSPVNVPLIRKLDERPASVFSSFFGNLSKNGMWIALAIIIGGVLLWHLASSLIGPDGWLGIWDKQKYVPPQFKADHDKEKRQLSKPLQPGGLPLGRRREWKSWLAPFFWIPKDLAIPPEMRANNPHVLILGGGEKGKSRLMAHMIAHDIESADRAVIVVDSDGGLADLLLRWIASHPDGEQFAKRVIVIDPTSNTPSPSFNPLEVPDDADLQNAASSIVHGFKAIYHEPPGSQNQWSPQTAHILRNCAMLLMANGKTLIDLPTLLQDNDFRDILLEQIEKQRKEKVEYATLLETWGQYKRLARTEQWINWYEPILNRVGPTLINQRIRPILTRPKGDINLKQIIAEKKILIVKIPKGQLHEDANLLGSLIVTGLKQAAISLCTSGGTMDRTAAMYLDEFDHFIEKETLDAITTETKKFQLGFTGSIKTLQHLPEDFRNQIVINIGTMCVFTLSKKDGDMLGPQMFRVSGRKAKHRTLMNIINKVNTSPQFELISDEEKFNIDRVLGQSERHFYAYRVGTVAGVFHMESHDFNDIPDDAFDNNLIELMYKNR